MEYSKIALANNMANTAELTKEPQALIKLNKAIQSHIIGQKNLIESLLIGILCDGHILIESMPGLAKTTAAKALAEGVDGNFHRIQFTPDLLPSDLIGTDVFNQATLEFTFKKAQFFRIYC
jgi:MoxR-like ATPase